ncbi:RebB family R body protein [Polaribacter sp. Hel1_85]|uniref:RebB family R body protein n=1 Tax=Polaribacter sp. Hel1_85 TaxID=1250005 RepID=UPI00052E290B|nr:RebB family R body protein [Polaribacter sp. Hel1_85]KGL58696.1 RebB-like protein [Polaribacter sp. Hel1_85]
MAFPTSENDQITDSVTQSNVQVLSNASAVALGTLYQTTSSAISLAFKNAVSNQQHNNTVAQTTTAISIDKILGKKNK